LYPAGIDSRRRRTPAAWSSAQVAGRNFGRAGYTEQRAILFAHTCGEDPAKCVPVGARETRADHLAAAAILAALGLVPLI
jgi:hypothetical protein